MSQVLDDLATRLVGQGAGTLMLDLFLGPSSKLPDGEGPFLWLIETPGSDASRMHNSVTENPMVQCGCRGISITAARTKLNLAYAALGGPTGLYNLTLNGTAYVRVVARQPPFSLGGVDGQGRALLAFNLAAEKKP